MKVTSAFRQPRFGNSKPSLETRAQCFFRLSAFGDWERRARREHWMYETCRTGSFLASAKQPTLPFFQTIPVVRTTCAEYRIIAKGENAAGPLLTDSGVRGGVLGQGSAAESADTLPLPNSSPGEPHKIKL